MITKGIRGAITVDDNTEDCIKAAVLELFKELIEKNSIVENNVSHIIFTMTSDLDAAYPAKFIRKDLGWNNTALMCLPELPIQNSLKMCLRILIVYNCEDNFVPQYVYLKGASNLRK